MRKIILLSSLMFLSLLACKKIDELTKFHMDYNQNFTIPSSIGINLPFNIMSPDIETNSESEFSVNNTRKDLIEEIKMTSLDLSVTSPSGADFSFLESISIYISAEDLPETLIAWKDDISDDPGPELSLETTNEDVKAYIKKDVFMLRLNTVTDEFITSDHEIEMNAVFFVDAKILGQ